MNMYKPFSQACENNKQPILDVLLRYFNDSSRVLEIGSGTGQHAVFMSSALPFLEWQPSDVATNIEGIESWVNDAALPNLRQPLLLDVTQTTWPIGFDAVYSANTAHIMSWLQVQTMIAQVAKILPRDGIFVLYGPFKYGGQFTSESNQAFDVWLKSIRANQGVRDFEEIQRTANSNGLFLLDDVKMPANNQCLVWKKQ